MNARIVEVSSPGWTFWRACLDTGIGLIVGSLYAFIGILIIAIVGEEALGALYREVDLDPVFRAGMGVIVVVWATLALVVPPVFVAERFAAFRAVERAALDDPDGIPPKELRQALAKAPAAQLESMGAITSWCLGGLGALFLIALLVTDLRDDAVAWSALGVIVALTVVQVALSSLGHRLRRGSEERVMSQHERWKRLAPLVDEADARRRDAAPAAELPGVLTVPSARVSARIVFFAVVALVVSLGAFIVSVYIRQQCRYCDPISYVEPIERGIDVLSLASGIALACCALLGVVLWTSAVTLRRLRERSLARWSRDGGVRRVDVEVVTSVVTGARALVRVQRAAAAAGAAMLVLALASRTAESSLLDADVLALTAGVLIPLGLAVGAADAARRRRERQDVRDASAPGDVPHRVGHGGAPRTKKTRSGRRA